LKDYTAEKCKITAYGLQVLMVTGRAIFHGRISTSRIVTGSLQGEATAPSGSRVLQEFGFRESAVIPC
jgi:hypothetical protein